jgi:molybdopterin biosynthesis enzyme
MSIIGGETDWNHVTSTAFLAENEKKEKTRQYFLPGTIKEINGRMMAIPSPYRHSSSLQSLTESKVLIVLPEGTDFVEKDSEVTVYHMW